MRLKKHPNFLWLNIRAFCSLWLPRPAFLKSRRFWTWTIAVYLGTFLSLLVGVSSLSRREVSAADIAGAALTITIPIQAIGMTARWWLEYVGLLKKRKPHRGFEVIAPKENAQPITTPIDME